MLERRAVVTERLRNLGSTTDAVARRFFGAISYLGAQVYPMMRWPSLTKYMQIEQLLCWSGMADIEHYSS